MKNIICGWLGRECLGCIYNIIKLPQQLCQLDIKGLAHIHRHQPLRRLKRTAIRSGDGCSGAGCPGDGCSGSGCSGAGCSGDGCSRDNRSGAGCTDGGSPCVCWCGSSMVLRPRRRLPLTLSSLPLGWPAGVLVLQKINHQNRKFNCG